jgi:competence protein ComEA
MKNRWRSFFSFTRMERGGIIALCSLLLLLLVVRTTMHLWVHPATDRQQELKLQSAWESFKRTQPRMRKDTSATGKNDYEDAFDENDAPMPAMININTADSATLVRLKGIGPATAAKIVAYRNANGAFTSISQLQNIRHFPDEIMNIFQKHLTVDTTLKSD